MPASTRRCIATREQKTQDPPPIPGVSVGFDSPFTIHEKNSAAAIVEDPVPLLRRLRRYFNRSEPTAVELNILRGIEVGHIFQLGTKYSEAMDAHVLDEDGRVVERGTHEDLLAEDGLYAHLWGVQAGEIDELPEEFVERAAERRSEIDDSDDRPP